ncbi:MAG: T9SS type A sorting domain-containing protein [Bacteroidia bacterium]
MKRIVTLLLLGGIFWPALAQTEHIVAPNTADPLSGTPNNYHFVYTNPNVAQKNKLFLFFPGTGGVPYAYRQILKRAANLGYHAIGLTYPNDIAINELCSGTTDITCHGRARLEVFDGTDRHPDITVDQNNCIQRRTQKLLQYLATHYPTENWAQYMDGNTIQWNNIIVSGHSQGGGHAGIISKLYEVDRVVMFAATDWVTAQARTAEWISWDGPTPAERYYGFVHRDDEMVNFLIEQLTWQDYSMDSFGALTLVDTAIPPYGNSHMLYTGHIPDNDPTKFHGSVVSDLYTPMDGNSPVFLPVWDYLINSSPTAATVTVNAHGVAIYPNPFSDTFELRGILPTDNVTLCDALGRNAELIRNGTSFRMKHDAASGLYVVQITTQQGTVIKKLIKN